MIVSSTELLEQGAAREQRQYVDNIRAESRRMKQLVEDMLTLSRVERGDTRLPDTTADLSDAAANVALRFEPVAYEAGHTLSYDIAPGLLVRGDGQKLEQAVAVLLDNAVKYNREGGRADINVADNEHDITVTVSDTGIGIPSDCIDRGFERFFRADKSHSRKIGGTGLGLSIVKHGVLLHGGNITVKSTEGTGTTFTLTLPKSK